MTAIKGQPAPKPQSLPATPAGAQDNAEADLFAPPSSDEMSMFAPPSDAEMQALNQALGVEGEAPADSFKSPWYTEALPIAGGIVGGVTGGIRAGPRGAIAGAALGGAAGESYKDLIETQLLGKPISTTEERLKSMGKAAAMEGAGAAVGEGIFRAAGAVGKGAMKYVSEPVKDYMKNMVKKAASSIEEPIAKILAERATKMNTEEAGNAAKELLLKNINGKYAPFIKAYGELDQIGAALPIRDESRRAFTEKTKAWALDHLGGDNYKIVRKFMDDINAAGNGKQLRDVVRQIGDAKSAAFKNNASSQYGVLKQLQESAEGFIEKETTDLAKRITAGKATPAEMAGFEQMMMAQKNPNVSLSPDNLAKYTKSVARDYLNSIEKVNSDYAGFRIFLSDVGEQTRVKVGNKGPMSFMSALEDMPSEKLIERMFDPKNAAALRQMQKETPEVFTVVAQSKMSQIIQKSSPTGKLDYMSLYKELNKMPEASRKLIFDDVNMELLKKVATNPRLKRIQNLEKVGDGMIAKWTQDLMTAAGIVGGEVTKSPGAMTVLKQTVGRPVVPPLRDMMMSQDQEE